MTGIVIDVLWAGWLGYWLLRARDNKATVRREAVGARLRRVMVMVAAAILLIAPVTPGSTAGPLAARFMDDSATLAWAGCALLATGLAFAIWARVHLGRNWSGRITIKQDHELIRSGPYALVRHPIYTGLLLAFAGTALASGTWASLLATALITGMLWSKIRLEERWMQEVFGGQYTQYRHDVRALIPFVL